MILDRLENAARYFGLHPGFRAAFEYLAATQLEELASGRQEIDGDRLFMILGRDQGRGRAGAKLEAHRRSIDIQCAFYGWDEIGWKATACCSQVDTPFDPQRDILFFADRPESWFTLAPGSFAILYPEDAHAPLGGSGQTHKAVFKVAVDWGND